MTVILVKLAVTALLLAGNAFFVLAEFALITVRPSRIEELIAAGRPRARLVRFAIERMDNLLAAVQFGITITSLGIGWLGEPAVAHLLSRWLPLPAALAAAFSWSLAFALAFVLISGLHILIGEQLPKLIAIRRSEAMIFLTIVPLTALYYLSWLPLLLLNQLTQLLLRLLRVGGQTEEQKPHTHDELRILLGRIQTAGQLSLDQYVMLSNVFDFGRGRIRDVMTQRDFVASLALDRPWRDNFAVITARRFSAYLLCASGPDTPVGCLLMRDLVLQPLAAGAEPDLRALMRPILTFQPDDALEPSLRAMQESARHYAAVVDHGRLEGIVTVEDIVEEIVGEIRDPNERRGAAQVREALVPAAARLPLAATDRLAAIEELLGALHDAAPGFDRATARALLFERERGLSSAVGHGVAFPHARLPGLDRPLLAFGHSPGIDFAAPDDQPVRLLFLMLTPAARPADHLQLQAQLATLLGYRQFRARLLAARGPNDLLEVVRSFESKVPE